MRTNKTLFYSSYLIILFSFFVRGIAQSNYNKLDFEYYTTANGLPDDYIYSLVQDKLGYVWIGTWNGLSRFDGYTFKNFTKDEGALSLKSNRIINISNLSDSLIGLINARSGHVLNIYNYKNESYSIEDSTEKSWDLNTMRGFEKTDATYTFLSKGGFFELSPSNKIIYSENYNNAKNPVNHKSVLKRSMLGLDSGRVIIYTSEEKTEIYYSSKKQKIKLPSNKVSKLLNLFYKFSGPGVLKKRLSRNEYVFLSLDENTIYYLNTANGKFTHSELPFIANTEIFLITDNIYSLSKNEFAISSDNGGFYVFFINDDGTIVCNSEKQQSKHLITSLMKDQEGRLWMGTQTGLYKQNNINSLVEIIKLHSVDPNTIYGKLFIINNKALILSSEGTHLIYDIVAKKVIRQISFFPDDEDWDSPSVFSIQNYYKDTLWLSIPAGIIWLDMNNFNYGKVRLPESLEYKALRMYSVNKEGKAWMCGFLQKPIAYYDIKTRSFKVYDDLSPFDTKPLKLRDLAYDSYGNVWFYGRGLLRWNKNSEKFDTVIRSFGRSTQFSDHFHSLRGDNYGNLWMMVPEIGMLRYSPSSGVTKLYGKLNSIAIDDVRLVSEIINDNLWLILNNKILCFNVKTEITNVYAQIHELPSIDFDRNIFYNKNSGDFYSTLRGGSILKFKNNLIKPKQKEIILSELNYNGINTLYHPKDTIHLNYDQNSISLYFNIIDFNLKYPQKFKYRVDQDSVWQNVVQGQQLFLYNLAYGWHTVTVKFDYDAENNATKVFTLFIAPPFWKTLWFYLFIAILVLGVATLFIFEIIKRARIKNEINLQLKEFEFKALHAQMNPHFIFNSLNSIKALILYDKNVEASQYLNKFSNLVRQNLDHSRKQFLTLTQNIEYISQYIEIEAIRFKDLNYEILVSKELDANEIKIAPMLLQPLIENAIWHGLQSAKGSKRLIIRFKTEASRVICEIEDNGIGINKTITENKKNHTSIGIENIRQRIHLLNEKYSINYLLEITDRSEINTMETGTLVTLSFNFF